MTCPGLVWHQDWVHPKVWEVSGLPGSTVCVPVNVCVFQIPKHFGNLDGSWGLGFET